MYQKLEKDISVTSSVKTKKDNKILILLGLMLLIGPLFVVCELLFVFGMLPKTREVIEREAGEIRHQTGPQAKAS